MADMNLTAEVKITKVDASAISAALAAEFSKVSGTIGAGAGKIAKGGGGEEGGKEDKSKPFSVSIIMSEFITTLASSISTIIMSIVEVVADTVGAVLGETIGLAVGLIVGAIVGVLAGVILAALGDIVANIIRLFTELGKMVSIFSGIGLALRLILDVIGAFWDGFKTVTKVWNMMLEMIAKLVEPFVNLLLPLMLPVLQLLAIMARLINMLIMPIFAALMKLSSGLMSAIGGIAQKFLSGDFSGALSDLFTALKPLVDALAGYLNQLIATYLPGFIQAILDFLTIDMDKVKTVLEQYLGKDFGDAVFFAINLFHYLASALAGIIAQLVGGDAFNKIFGEGQFENIQKTNEGFKKGISLGTTLQGLYTQLNDFLTALIANPIATIWNLLTSTITSVVNALMGVAPTTPRFGHGQSYEEEAKEKTGLIASIVNTALNVYNFGKSLIDYWTNTLKLALDALVTYWNDTLLPNLSAAWLLMFGADGKGGKFKTWCDDVDTLAGAILKWANEMNAVENNPVAYFKKKIDEAIANWIAGQQTATPTLGPTSGTITDTGETPQIPGPGNFWHGYTPPPTPTTSTDFISRPGHGVQNFSPLDTIVGVQNPSALGGGSTTYNINIYGNGDRAIADIVKKAVEDVNARSGRTGYFQLGR